MKSPVSSRRFATGGRESEADEIASPVGGPDHSEELRLAAEMGQLLIKQKQELQIALDDVKGMSKRAVVAQKRAVVAQKRAVVAQTRAVAAQKRAVVAQKTAPCW